MAITRVAGLLGVDCRMASAALALVTAAVEPRYGVMAFATDFRALNISPGQRLDDAVRTVSELPMGDTDCSLPMTWALKNNVPVDIFQVYTDSETWAGRIHPKQALDQYRQKTGRPAKLAVIGMASNGFSLASKDDGGMLDVVGLDPSVPAVLADFAR